jgi:hypothetical protein
MKGKVSSAGGVPSRSISVVARMGLAMTGPSPATKSRSRPMPISGGRISAKTIAASTLNCWIGSSVISRAISGVRNASNMLTLARMARYSGW